MKKSFFLLLIISVVACKKTDSDNVDSVKIVDSINAVRTKINDSILSTNRFKDWEGVHGLTHNEIKGKGKVDFSKIGRDEYKMIGELANGKNYVKIDGIATMKSDRHLSFTGTITQSIDINNNGKVDMRSGKKTFLTKDGGKTFRLQEMVNDAGFVDHIDIKF